MISGRFCRNSAIRSWPTAVELNVCTYRPGAGSAHTEAAPMRARVLPVPLFVPHRWTKNGRQCRGFTSAEAKEAASAILPGRVAQMSVAASFHSP